MLNEDDLQQLGLQITQRRERLGMSQDALAEKAALSKNYVGQIERGKVNPSYLVLLKLAKALDSQVSDFFPDVRHGLPAESLAIAKLVTDTTPAVREAIVTLLLASQHGKSSR